MPDERDELLAEAERLVLQAARSEHGPDEEDRPLCASLLKLFERARIRGVVRYPTP